MSSVLRLSGLTPIGRGSHRLCYRHPEYPDRCVKVLLVPVAKEAAAGPGIAVRADLQASPDENTLDFENYQELEGRHEPALWRHIPRCHGMVATDLGPGLVTDYILNADGSPAQPLARRIQENYDAPCRAALEELKAFLLRHVIRIGDLHPSNLLLCLRPGETRERLYIIDGLADRHFVWSPWLRPFHKLKVRRKIRRMEWRIARTLEELAEARKGA